MRLIKIWFFVFWFCFLAFEGWAAVWFGGVGFWEVESLENGELRGGEALQLNTRPLVTRTDETGFVFDSVYLEYGNSDAMPQIEHRMGNWISGGDNWLVNGRFGFLHSRLTVSVEPEVSWHENREYSEYPAGATHPVARDVLHRVPDEKGSYSQADLKSAYVTVPFYNWYLFLGKDPLVFGAGKHDTLHLSDSSEAFPMVRLGTISPADTFLGYFSYLTYVGEMESERHVPRAKFAGMRIDWSTSKRLEIGMSRSWFVGGDGQNNSFSHVYWDLYTEFFKPTSGVDTYSDFRNQQLVFDFRFKIPEIKLVLYGEYGREDHEFSWQDAWYKRDRTQANILGMKQIDLLPGFFWIVERANTVQPSQYDDAVTAWYQHYEYRSGWTYKGIGLGHHMGPDSSDEFYAVGYQSDSLSVMAFYDEEMHGVRSREEDRREQKIERGVRGVWEVMEDVEVEFLAMNQRYWNFGFESGVSVESNVVLVGVEMGFGRIQNPGAGIQKE